MAQKILVVEDNAQCAALAKGLLEQVYVTAGADVKVAGTAADGLGALNTYGFDMLILDLDLPDSDTHKTLESFSAHIKRLATIVVSGYCTPDVIAEANRVGADVWIPKEDLSLTTLRLATRLATLEHGADKMANVLTQ